MSLHRHNPAELSPPTGFSHAVTATGTRFVFLAGQTALDSGREEVRSSPPPRQAPTALRRRRSPPARASHAGSGTAATFAVVGALVALFVIQVRASDIERLKGGAMIREAAEGPASGAPRDPASGAQLGVRPLGTRGVGRGELEVHGPELRVLDLTRPAGSWKHTFHGSARPGSATSEYALCRLTFLKPTGFSVSTAARRSDR
ncbi:hypothetical protein STANM309S_06531 [Streptomyces tanashiensis]